MLPPIPPSGFDDNYYSQVGCEYFDRDDVPSDPEDAAGFDYNWADVPPSDEPPAEEFKSNAEFNNYFITAKARRTTAKHVSAALTSVASTALKSPHTALFPNHRHKVSTAAPILALLITCFLIGQLLFPTIPRLIAM
jgi:hypothetical protein